MSTHFMANKDNLIEQVDYLKKLDGTILPASHSSAFPFKDASGKNFTVNQYSQRQPESWTGTKNQFARFMTEQEEAGRNVDGIYFILD